MNNRQTLLSNDAAQSLLAKHNEELLQAEPLHCALTVALLQDGDRHVVACQVGPPIDMMILREMVVGAVVYLAACEEAGAPLPFGSAGTPSQKAFLAACYQLAQAFEAENEVPR